MTHRFRPPTTMPATALAAALLAVFPAHAQTQPQADAPRTLDEVVVSASRSEQRRFDAPAAVDSVKVDDFHATSPLVNMSELLQAVPGVQVRNRENYAQDLQISVRGFGTRSTFGVRGVRILVDGIPATMPDGQGQAATASLTSAERIEVLRGPVAQLYGNAAGGVVQVFTRDPVTNGFEGTVGVGAGSYGQREQDVSLSGGSKELAGLLDLSHFSTDGYRDHSAAERTQLNGKVVAHPSSDTTITGLLNLFHEPETQDPLGLTRALFERDPRQAVSVATTFNTRKSIDQQQAGVVVDHRFSDSDSVSARVYGGQRKVFQTLSIPPAAPGSGGVVDLNSGYGGLGVNWTHKTALGQMPLRWTVGMDADTLNQYRRGLTNVFGTPGALKRDEFDRADDLDFYGQAELRLDPRWAVTAGVRNSRVRFSVDDHLGGGNSGNVQYRNTSPVAGVVWSATDDINVYANIGTGFETPTLAESAYSATGNGPNLTLQPSKSTQGEIGIKAKAGRHEFDAALFDARSRDEIVVDSNTNGRSIYRNAEKVDRRGVEFGWKAGWRMVRTQLAYTLVDARFKDTSTNSAGATIPSGSRLPGVPEHSLYADVEYRPVQPLSLGLETRIESKVYVSDANADAASGYATFAVRAGYEFRALQRKMFLFGRVDNLFDRDYAGSVIVNDGNQRYFEPAAGRRMFVGLRTMF
ncbi:MAG: TonB-dependent receptor family protein [Burkholderiaceae bacterium]